MDEEFDFQKYKLTDRQRLYCEHRVLGNDQRDCMIAAGYAVSRYKNNKTLASHCYQIEHLFQVAKYLQWLRVQSSAKTVLTKREVLQKLSHLANSHIDIFLDWGSNDDKVWTRVHSLRDIAKHDRYAVKNIKITTDKNTGDDKIEISTHDKQAALEALLNHHEKAEAMKNVPSSKNRLSEEVKSDLIERISSIIEENSDR